MNHFARAGATLFARPALRQQAVRSLAVSASLALRGGARSGPNPAMFGALAAGAALTALITNEVVQHRSPAQMMMGPFMTDSEKAAIDERFDQLELAMGIKGVKTHAAFVFVKPHAVTPGTVELVKKMLGDAGIKITSTGRLDAQTIDEKRLIDTHYGAIASKAVVLKPSELTVQPKAKAQFQKAFGMTWEQALKKGLVYNAKDACAKLGIDGMGLDAKWSQLKRGENLIKFGGGFYCGQVDGIFVMNGFYMSMRSAYTTPPASIVYFTVEWPADKLTWEDFRGKVLGATDPKTAEPGAVRRAIYDSWQSLGLPGQPNTGDNGVHASASPFEALAERINWLDAKVHQDVYGAAMLAAGIPRETIMAWTQDPQVNFQGRSQSLFDLLEDIDAKPGLDKACEIMEANSK